VRRRLHEQSRRLVQFLEGKRRLEATPELRAALRDVYLDDVEDQAESRAQQSRVIAQLSPDAYDCPEHLWMAPRRFPGEPRLPASMVKVRCPDCIREARVEPPVAVDPEPLVDHWHSERTAIAQHPKVEALYEANLARNAKPGQPRAGSKEEAEAIAQMDDARHDVGWRDMTAEQRRRASERYWRSASLVDLGLPSRYSHKRIPAGSVNVRANVNSIHAGRAW
jgi:hypothetical protein